MSIKNVCGLLDFYFFISRRFHFSFTFRDDAITFLRNLNTLSFTICSIDQQRDKKKSRILYILLFSIVGLLLFFLQISSLLFTIYDMTSLDNTLSLTLRKHRSTPQKLGICYLARKRFKRPLVSFEPVLLQV